MVLGDQIQHQPNICLLRCFVDLTCGCAQSDDLCVCVVRVEKGGRAQSSCHSGVCIVPDLARLPVSCETVKQHEAQKRCAV